MFVFFIFYKLSGRKISKPFLSANKATVDSILFCKLIFIFPIAPPTPEKTLKQKAGTH